MFVFAHTGLTLGVAILLNVVFAKDNQRPARTERFEEQFQDPSRLPPSPKSISSPPASWIASLAKRIDIRILLVGSLLPDIIDKPIGRFFFSSTFANGRIYSHTLLFLVLITAGGLILYRTHKKTWLIALAFGTFTHLIFDGMWLEPRTLLWPLYGFSFAKYPVSTWSWILRFLQQMATQPWLLIPEIVGIIILTWFTWKLARRRNLLTFFKYGSTNLFPL